MDNVLEVETSELKSAEDQAFGSEDLSDLDDDPWDEGDENSEDSREIAANVTGNQTTKPITGKSRLDKLKNLKPIFGEKKPTYLVPGRKAKNHYQYSKKIEYS